MDDRSWGDKGGGDMKVIGFSAGSVGRKGNIDRMVKAILEKSGHDCRLEDDAQPYYQKVKEADAVVIGTPVYFDAVTSTAWAFIERFFGYRHVDIPIAGKPFVTVVGGAMTLDSAIEQLHKMLGAFEVNVIDTVRFQSKVPPCFKCGRHRECEIGGLYMMLGDPAKELTITKEMFTRWEDHSATAAAVDAAAQKLKTL
jgi:multimeric flavodoxin WrbA